VIGKPKTLPLINTDDTDLSRKAGSSRWRRDRIEQGSIFQSGI